MRLAAAAFTLLMAVPALAQSQYATGRGAYLALETLSFARGGLQQLDGTVGARLAGGVDVGVRLGHESAGSGYGPAFSIGPVAGISRPLGNGLEGRIEGAIRYSTLSGNSPTIDPAPGSSTLYNLKTITEDVTATVSRSVRIVGSVRIRPAVGVYATAIQTPASNDLAQAGTPTGRAGLHLHIPVSFRLLGADVAWAPAVFRLTIVPNARLQGVNDQGYYEQVAGMEAFGGTGLRVNF